ncbi:MAG: hypothetical protein J2P15_01880, partial [Micromonosporaceae bacterium]|nr:hypothetical protein [Micromonosporaceae bacterium]
MFNSRLLNLAGLVVALGMLAGLGGFYLVGQGIPVAPAFFLAVLATAVVMMVVDFRAGATVPAFGIAMFCIGALIGARAAVDLLPATSRWVVVPGAFVVEAALLVGIVRVYRMRLLRNRSRLRHEMAQQRGWRYLLRA